MCRLQKAWHEINVPVNTPGGYGCSHLTHYLTNINIHAVRSSKIPILLYTSSKSTLCVIVGLFVVVFACCLFMGALGPDTQQIHRSSASDCHNDTSEAMTSRPTCTAEQTFATGLSWRGSLQNMSALHQYITLTFQPKLKDPPKDTFSFSFSRPIRMHVSVKVEGVNMWGQVVEVKTLCSAIQTVNVSCAGGKICSPILLVAEDYVSYRSYVYDVVMLDELPQLDGVASTFELTTGHGAFAWGLLLSRMAFFPMAVVIFTAYALLLWRWPFTLVSLDQLWVFCLLGGLVVLDSPIAMLYLLRDTYLWTVVETVIAQGYVALVFLYFICALDGSSRSDGTAPLFNFYLPKLLLVVGWYGAFVASYVLEVIPSEDICVNLKFASSSIQMVVITLKVVTVFMLFAYFCNLVYLSVRSVMTCGSERDSGRVRLSLAISMVVVALIVAWLIFSHIGGSINASFLVSLVVCATFNLHGFLLAVFYAPFQWYRNPSTETGHVLLQNEDEDSDDMAAA